jgi:hypothetical protein
MFLRGPLKRRALAVAFVGLFLFGTIPLLPFGAAQEPKPSSSYPSTPYPNTQYPATTFPSTANLPKRDVPPYDASPLNVPTTPARQRPFHSFPHHRLNRFMSACFLIRSTAST